MKISSSFVVKSFPLPSGTSTVTPSGSLFAVIPLVLAMALLWPLGGGHKITMTSGQAVPAAKGTVLIFKGDNNNTRVETKVRFLANPSSLTPPENVYVVWLQPDGQAPQNEGQLQVDKNLSGQVETVTPYKSFRIFVTAEKASQMQAPMGPQVLTADISVG